MKEIKYLIYRIGIDDSNYETGNIIESFSKNFILNLPRKKQLELVENFRIIADQIENGYLAKK